MPGLRRHPGQDGKRRGLRLPSCGRSEQESVRAPHHRLDGLHLETAEPAPSQRVDDVVLDHRVEPSEGLLLGRHGRSRWTSSTLAAARSSELSSAERTVRV